MQKNMQKNNPVSELWHDEKARLVQLLWSAIALINIFIIPSFLFYFHNHDIQFTLFLQKDFVIIFVLYLFTMTILFLFLFKLRKSDVKIFRSANGVGNNIPNLLSDCELNYSYKLEKNAFLYLDGKRHIFTFDYDGLQNNSIVLIVHKSSQYGDNYIFKLISKNGWSRNLSLTAGMIDDLLYK